MKKLVVACALMVPSTVVFADGVEKWNFSFGLGVEQYRDDYIEQASIKGESRIVVVEKVYETKPSGWLTISWNFLGLDKPTPKLDDKGAVVLDKQGRSIDVNDVKFGFFAGTKLISSDSSAFESFSLGPQITFVAEDRDISVGFGWVTHKTKKLASGIQEGQSLPEQYDDVTYKEGTENSYMMMLSIAL